MDSPEEAHAKLQSKERVELPAAPVAQATDVCRLIVDLLDEAVIMADTHGVVIVWNRAAERLFGYAPAEMVGASLDIIIPERFRQAHWNGYQRAMSSGLTKYGDRVMTTRSVHKNGGKCYVDLSFRLVKDAAGGVIGALGIARAHAYATGASDAPAASGCIAGSDIG